MTGVNKAILIGHLGRDPETRRGASGDAIVTFSIATSEGWRDKATGERKERTEWHNIVIFNEALGKIAADYLKKGSKVYLEGQMRTREYQDKAGVTRRTTEVVLAKFRGELTLLDSQGQRPPPAEGEDSYGTTRSRDAAAAAPQRLADVIDDDIPF